MTTAAAWHILAIDAEAQRPLLWRSPGARRATLALLGLHVLLLVFSLPDYRTSVDNGYHVSLARLYGEHGTAFWDPLNYGPDGRPNLNAPLQHAITGALGRVLGGDGSDYILASDLLAVLQWSCAMLTVWFFARRHGGDGAALLAVCVASGGAFTAYSFYSGIPSGWVFVLTPWAIHFFLQRREVICALATAACIGFHLGGYATAPLGVCLAALLTGRWWALLRVGGLVALLSAPYSIHLLLHLDWYQGEPGHSSFLVEPLVIAFIGLGLIGSIARAREEPFLLSWLLSGVAWLAVRTERFVVQGALAGAVAGSCVLVHALARLPHRLAVALLGGLAAVAVLFPAAPPSLGAEALWLLGFDYPRPIDWREIRAVAEAIERERLQDRLFSVYNISFGSAISVYTSISQELGHWVEVRPVPDPADELLPDDKAYVVPVPSDDELLAELDAEGLIELHGGSAGMSVVTLPEPTTLDAAAPVLAPLLAGEARWLAEHAQRNTFGDAVTTLLEPGALEERRGQLAAQRSRAGRLLVAWIAYGHALAGSDPAAGVEAARLARGLGGMATFLGDEASADFIDSARQERMRENLTRAAVVFDGLANRPNDPEARRALERLFREFFWAA